LLQFLALHRRRRTAVSLCPRDARTSDRAVTPAAAPHSY